MFVEKTFVTLTVMTNCAPLFNIIESELKALEKIVQSFVLDGVVKNYGPSTQKKIKVTFIYVIHLQDPKSQGTLHYNSRISINTTRWTHSHSFGGCFILLKCCYVPLCLLYSKPTKQQNCGDYKKI